MEKDRDKDVNILQSLVPEVGDNISRSVTRFITELQSKPKLLDCACLLIANKVLFLFRTVKTILFFELVFLRILFQKKIILVRFITISQFGKYSLGMKLLFQFVWGHQ